MSRLFNLFLFILLLATGILWLIDVFYLRRRENIKKNTVGFFYNKLFIIINYSINIFPILLIVFSFRSFIFEPFRIPSESMLPTLQPGDLIIVNKHSYNIKLPLINRDILSLSKPRRGDVIVFHYPYSKKVDYIKRIIGLPGDRISYQNKRLSINDVEIKNNNDGFYYDHNSMHFINKYNESLDNVVYKILSNKGYNNSINPYFDFPFLENFKYCKDSFSCIVPDDNYFVMGDNRDNSFDSRYWGFVPYHNIVGKAFFIWMNFNDISRIGYLN
ncbi:signal peptidase I [Candidatus Kinetoplastibacterium oncopeltii TCC290E]|uniref:Signal peptidase I n=1 Tax=Candidatus Kinetoplastidibacterium stringomonadis TCC290E TaxID=1208920 RepID=M1LZ96_9PROT|nr:signal peptidase I [Candidatus Kinetoplastibacterium oncopeltii]AGF48444.1 signal peptidase I [Candidatus Kinetoplastibacterium oncopeltii TCC290E]